MEGQPPKKDNQSTAATGKPQEQQKQQNGPSKITSFFKKNVEPVTPTPVAVQAPQQPDSPSQMVDVVVPQNLQAEAAKLDEEELKCLEQPLSPGKASQPRGSSAEESPGKRHLRPRKVENYQAMLDDEVTRKTIMIEEQEKKRLALVPHEEDEELLRQEIERASDDEDEEDEVKLIPAKRGRKAAAAKPNLPKRVIDDEDDEVDGEEEEDSAALIEEDEEESYAVRGSKRKTKTVRKNAAAGGTRGGRGKRGGKASASAAPRGSRSKSGRTNNKVEDDPEEDDPTFEHDAAAEDDPADDEDEEEDDEDEDEVRGKGAVANGDETVFIDNLPNDEFEIRRMLKEVKKHIKSLEKQFFEEEDSEKEDELKQQISNVAKHEEALAAFKEHAHLKQFWCIPLSVNVTSFDFDLLGKSQMKSGGRLFDVITIDPPWQLSSANPTRGVAIAYDTLNDKQILDIPFDQIQSDGFLFIWVINAKYLFALDIMEKNGYKLVDEIAWVKQTVNGKIAKGHGYYLQHAKETCLVGVKGNVEGKARLNIESDVIFSQRRGQSQKPEEIYEIAESLVPNGYYLEIFGRRNNLHNGWVTIGNEL